MDTKHNGTESPRSASPGPTDGFDEETIYVVTRRGKYEELDPTKIRKRLQKLTRREPKITGLNPDVLMLKAMKGIKSGITTSEIDEYVAGLCSSMGIRNPNYLKLAARLLVSNHQRNTLTSFHDKMKKLYLRKDLSGNVHSLLAEDAFEYIEEHQKELEDMIDYSRDYLTSYFGMRTFLKKYGLKVNGKTVERPQDAYMRIAICLYRNSESDPEKELEYIKTAYDGFSLKKITQASPSYFNACTPHEQLSSCFLLGTEDSITGIMNKTACDITKISKWGGGLGLHINCWRASGALIRGTNGKSSGIGPFLRIYNNAMRAFNQGGKRPGSLAVYLMPHHPDILTFLKLKLKGGDEEERARDLFYAVWLPDLFMERVAKNQQWSLFDPDMRDDQGNVIDLSNYYDPVFDPGRLKTEYKTPSGSYTAKYLELEKSKRYVKQIPARAIWDAIYESNKTTGTPYICFSDHANRLSNQRNIGVIKSSNLCAEIMEYSTSEETAVCNLCSISLASCVKDRPVSDSDSKTIQELDDEFPTNPYFDFEQLKQMTRNAVRNLNRVIDVNYYPTERTKRSNMKHRPIGVGYQGLADAFLKMRLPFESEEARKLNKRISETMYYSAIMESSIIAKEIFHKLRDECKEKGSISVTKYTAEGKLDTVKYTDPNKIPQNIGAYDSYTWNGGSPLSKGIFHWEKYGLSEDDLYMAGWDSLRAHIEMFGTRNSLCIALMPTASTSQFLGNNECFEPYTSNVLTRTTLAGNCVVVNKYLIRDARRLGFWDDQFVNAFIAHEGSIQEIGGIPQKIKDLYKIAHEIDPKILVQYAIDRQPFIDQSQSFNWYMRKADQGTLTKLAKQGWLGQLKTLKYYLHTKPAAMAQKFTIDPKSSANAQVTIDSENIDLSFLDKKEETCDMCSA